MPRPSAQAIQAGVPTVESWSANTANAARSPSHVRIASRIARCAKRRVCVPDTARRAMAGSAASRHRNAKVKSFSKSNIANGRFAVDLLLDCYVSWREECLTVRVAYDRWSEGDRLDRQRAYAGYLAALDREEQAARVYADQLERVSRICN